MLILKRKIGQQILVAHFTVTLLHIQEDYVTLLMAIPGKRPYAVTVSPREQITLASDIELTLLRKQQRQVLLGFEAPRHIPILRAELLASASVLS